MKLLEINKLNVQLLINFIISQKNTFSCIILPDITNIMNLINNNTYKIYSIIQNDKLICCYIFRDSHMYYNNKKSIEFFASISDVSNKEIFIIGFIAALYKYTKLLKAKMIIIENISHNNLIIEYILSLNVMPIITSPTAYFFYNYASRPIEPTKTFIMC